MTDAEVVSWALELDQSGDISSDPSYYRKAFTEAIDVHASRDQRSEAAGRALDYFDSKTKPALDDLAQRNQTLDRKSLALVEIANSLTVGPPQKKAMEIAGLAREAQQQLELLEQKYSDIYGLQLGLLREIVENRGDLAKSFSGRDDQLTKFKELAAERDDLLTKEQALERKIEEQYAAFKGMTGIV